MRLSSPARRQSDASGREDPRHSDSGFPRRRLLRRSSQSYENLSVRMNSNSGMRASASCEDLSHLVAERSSASDDVLRRRSRISSAPVSRKTLSGEPIVPTNKSADEEKPTNYPDLTSVVRSHQKKQGVGQQVNTYIHAACLVPPCILYLARSRDGTSTSPDSLVDRDWHRVYTVAMHRVVRAARIR